MEKCKGFETVEGSIFNSKSSDFFVPNAKVKHYLYFFRCPKCKQEYTLSELVKQRRNVK